MKKQSVIVLVFVFLFLIGGSALALTMRPNPYTALSGQTVYIVCTNSSDVLYYWVENCASSPEKLEDGQCGLDASVWGGEDCALFEDADPSTELTALLQNTSGDNLGFPNKIVLVETTDYSSACESSLSDCRTAEEYAGELTIQVEAPIASVSSGSSQASGVLNFVPEVRLITQLSGTYRGVIQVRYSAIDTDGGDLGLVAQPIDIFYSDDSGYSWQKIAQEQLNSGLYLFDTAWIPDGDNYRLRVVAIDGNQSPGSADSGVFSIDNAAPTFDIFISPDSPVKETDEVTFKIISSEVLRTLPTMTVTQAGFQAVNLALAGSGREFYASHRLTRGYPGKAVVAVSGEDLVGNVGQVVTSGKSFSIERFGPPPPLVIEPVDNQVFSSPEIRVLGETQPNLEVRLILNGLSNFTAFSTADGSFEIKGVSLSLTPANYGSNTLSVTAFNEKKEESEEVVLKLKLNSPPKVSSTSFNTKEIFSGFKDINWLAADLNADKLIFSIEYSSDKEASWDCLASDLSTTTYRMDTTQLADGSDYYFKITADDGTVKSSTVFPGIIVKNNLPHIALDIPANYFTNTSTPVLRGKVTGSERNVISAAYSMDGGENWQDALALDGNFNSLSEKIEIAILDPLSDGKYTILIKATDASNRSVKISRSFTVDTLPPPLDAPLLNQVVSDAMDTNTASSGVQVLFQGKSEAHSAIELLMADKIYRTTADENGTFAIDGLTLPLHGPNQVSLKSIDRAGNITEIQGAFILNNPPRVGLLNPKAEEFLGGLREISWEAEDADDDQMVSDLLYQKKGGEWIVLDEGVGSPYQWDLSKVKGGDYRLKVAVSDGMSKSEAAADIFIDNTPPLAELEVSSTLLTRNTIPDFSGRAWDEFSGIQYAEYSFDGVNWYKALIKTGYQSPKADFQFKYPQSLTDGQYKVETRVSDRAGNVTYLEPVQLTIDTTPPRIGSNMISSGNLVLFPDESGAIKLFESTPYKILVSVAGDAALVSLNSGRNSFQLDFNKSTLLWESEFRFDEIGSHSLSLYAQDAVGNAQDKEIAVLNVISLGRIYSKETGGGIEEAEVTLYLFDQTASSWLVWDAQAFGQENPRRTGNDGQYGFLVPPGKYRLEISHPRFKTAKSEDFQITDNYFINISVPLTDKGFLGNLLNRLVEMFKF